MNLRCVGGSIPSLGTNFMETSQYIISKLLNQIPHFPKRVLTNRRLRILEPSAGTGRLARALRSTRDAIVDCCEYNKELAEELKRDGFHVPVRDFFQFQPNAPDASHLGSGYDYVVAVPPYKDNEDTTHIMHMYRHCKPGGKVISLTLPYWTTGIFSVQREFRQWLADKDYRLQFIEDESYVNCPKAIIIINKL